MSPDARADLLCFIDSRPEPGFPDELETMEQLARFTEESGDSALREARALRDSLAGLLLPGAAASGSCLEELIDRYDLRPRVEGAGPVRYAVCSRSAIPHLASCMLTAVIEMYAAGEAQHLKVCGADNCIVPFVDTSPTQRREYCCPKCATRMRVRRHRL